MILDNIDKKSLLDILAYILWDEQMVNELGTCHIDLSERLYKEILSELRGQAEQHSVSCSDAFTTINLKCRSLGTLFYLEKRLEILKERLAERLHIFKEHHTRTRPDQVKEERELLKL